VEITPQAETAKALSTSDCKAEIRPATLKELRVVELYKLFQMDT
jgi:hypothetical protein